MVKGGLKERRPKDLTSKGRSFYLRLSFRCSFNHNIVLIRRIYKPCYCDYDPSFPSSDVKGSLTEKRPREGLLDSAGGGTLFDALDECVSGQVFENLFDFWDYLGVAQP